MTSSPTPTRMPALFLGHGNPMNALDDNDWTRAWSGLGASMPRPTAVLAVSAHWYVRGSRVTGGTTPPTVHDFGGFPDELFRMQYPAPGSPDLAARVVDLLAPTEVRVDDSWGIDHGTWSLLVHVFPEADVPVVQLSIDTTLTPAAFASLTTALRPLRDEGVLVLGSGNVVHNLRRYDWSGTAHGAAHEWAARFDAQVRELALGGDLDALAAYPALGNDAMASVPTPEHYLPLLAVLALRDADEAVTFPVSGFDGGAISMLGVQVG